MSNWENKQFVNQVADKQPNIFLVPKDVFCEEHKNQKIEWLNLSAECERRLYCIQCIRPQNQFIFKYEEIFKKHFLEREEISVEWFVEELFKVKNILFQQIGKINDELQLMHNYYKRDIALKLYHNFIHPRAELTYQQLFEISEHLSKKVFFHNNMISFSPEISIENKERLDQLIECIRHFQKCAILVEKIVPIQGSPTFNLLLCRNIEEQKKENLRTLLYDQAISFDMEFEISAVDMEWNQSCILVAGSKDKNNYEIQIWDLDKQNMKISRLLQTLKGHKSKIEILQISWLSIISIDQSQKMIFWGQQTRRSWFLGRQFDVQMQQINCIKYDYGYNLLALGGSYLQIWKLDNSDKMNPINLIEPKPFEDNDITCLDFNVNRQKLAAGNNNGIIFIFEEINKDWKYIQELKVEQQQIRNIGFISDTDFISISLGNILTQWKYFSETGYDYLSKYVENMDYAIFAQEKVIMINPIQICTDENGNAVKLPIAQGLVSFYLGASYLIVCNKNLLKIFALRENQ